MKTESVLKLDVSGSKLLLAIGNSFRELEWSQLFGPIQTILITGFFEDQKIRQVSVDLSECRWADPIPLLSLIMSLCAFQNNGGKCIVILPSIEKTDLAALRFLKYLAQEGFSNQLIQHGFTILYEAGDRIDAETINKHASLAFDLVYVDSTFLPAQVLDIGDDPVIVKDKINSLLAAAEGHLQQIPRWAHEDLHYRLYLFLIETLINIQEHAYKSTADKKKWVGIYVRYRTGKQIIQQDAREVWKETINAEVEYCPLLRKDFLDSREGCLEAFVIDSGQGIVESFRQSGAFRTGESTNYPFRTLAKNILLDGLTTKKDKLVPSGGLHLLHGILSQNNDYIRGKDGREWIGTACPLQRRHSKYYVLTDAAKHIQGLSWVVRLSWRVKTDVGEGWQRFMKQSPHPILKILQFPLEERWRSFIKKSFVYDFRFNQTPVSTPGSKANDVCLLLVKPGMMKWDIRAWLDQLVGKNVNPNLMKTLFIADIPAFEATTYIAALTETRWMKTEWPVYVDKIVLISQHWAVYALFPEKISSREIAFKKDESSAKMIFAEKNTGKPLYMDIGFIANWIRYHDSNQLWESLAKRSINAFLPTKIGWGKDEKGHEIFLDGYLDFGQMLTNPQCTALLRQAMKRVPGLFPFNFRLTALDRLTRNLVEEFNATEFVPLYPTNNNYVKLSRFGSDNNENTIKLGSVVVTGGTLRATGARIEKTLHFFKHPFAPDKEFASLFLWPQKEWLASKFKDTASSYPADTIFSRVGKTPVVAPGGRRYFPIPRFDVQKAAIADRDPHQTYEDWQRMIPQIMRIGHWAYEVHHDFLTINLFLAVRDSFVTFGDLATFLVREFFSALEIRSHQLNDNGKMWYKKMREHTKETEGGKESNRAASKVTLIVYPSHPNTELIVEELLKCINETSYETVRSRIIPAIPISRSHDGSAMLVSPLTLERIRNTLTQSKLKKVLIFDDAVISGRTIRELKCILDEAGADEIEACTIVNRMRLPQARRHIGSIRHYWRLDVPVLGGHKTCPLCRSLEETRSFQENIVSKRAKSRLENWLGEWAPCSSVSQWNLGIRGVALPRKLRKKFSLYYDSDKKNYEPLAFVNLTRSIGLTTYVSELHAMTGLTDDAIRFCEHEKKNGVAFSWTARVELYSAQLLLYGNEYEQKTLMQMFTQVIAAACESLRSDRWTSLAALVVILLARGDLSKAVNDALFLAGKQPNNLCWDVEMLLSYLLYRGYLKNANGKFDNSERLLSSKSLNLAGRYNLLHLETLDISGNAHSKPLSRWATGRTYSDNRDKETARGEARDSLDKILDLLSTFNSNHARPNPARQFSFTEARDKLFRMIRQTMEVIKLDTPAKIGDSRILAGNVIQMLGQLRDNFFFFRLGSVDLNRKRIFEDTILEPLFSEIDWQHIREVKESSRRDPVLKSSISWEVNFGEFKPRELWVIWDNQLRLMIQNLMMNAIHSAVAISDPWRRMPGEADIWLSVKYSSKELILSLVNQSDKKAPEVHELACNRDLWPHLYDLGGYIQYIQLQDNLIEVQVKLPYAGTLVQSEFKCPQGGT